MDARFSSPAFRAGMERRAYRAAEWFEDHCVVIVIVVTLLGLVALLFAGEVMGAVGIAA